MTVWPSIMAKKGNIEWYEYVYDEYYDCVICPENQILTYTTTNKDGYQEYKSDPVIYAEAARRGSDVPLSRTAKRS